MIRLMHQKSWEGWLLSFAFRLATWPFFHANFFLRHPSTLVPVFQQQLNVSHWKLYQMTWKNWLLVLIIDQTAYSDFSDLQNLSIWSLLVSSMLLVIFFNCLGLTSLHSWCMAVKSHQRCNVLFCNSQSSSKQPDCHVLWSFRTNHQMYHSPFLSAWNPWRKWICSGGKRKQEKSAALRCGYGGLCFIMLSWIPELWSIMSSSYLGLWISNQIYILTSSKRCSKLVVGPVFYVPPSGKDFVRLGSQWKKWVYHLLSLLQSVAPLILWSFLAHLHCSRAICRKASWVYLKNWQVQSRTAHFCWWVFSQLLDYIQRLCMVYLRY